MSLPETHTVFEQWNFYLSSIKGSKPQSISHRRDEGNKNMKPEVDTSCVQPLGASRSMHCDSASCPVFPAADLQHCCALHHCGGADHWSGNIASSASDVRDDEMHTGIQHAGCQLSFISNAGCHVQIQVFAKAN